MQGLHLTADLNACQCDTAWLTDAARLLEYCEHAVRQVGLQPVARLAHHFSHTSAQPSGVTATVLLAESHLCVHTWPELGAVTLDVYVCNFGQDHSAKAQALMTALIDHFDPTQVQHHALQRGALPQPLKVASP